jgi:hypothetical protein
MNRLSIILTVMILLLLEGCIQIQFVEIQSLDELENPTPNISPTIPNITNTKTPTQTVTTTISPTSTQEPDTSQIEIAIDDAACYLGPDSDLYSIISYISMGDQVVLVGKNPNGDWLHVQENKFNKFCWIEVSKVDANSTQIENLPIVAPPPPPTFTPIPSATPTRRSPEKENGGYQPPYPPSWPYP